MVVLIDDNTPRALVRRGSGQVMGTSPADFAVTPEPVEIPAAPEDEAPVLSLLPDQLIDRYVASAMRRAWTERLDDGTWYAEVEILRGVLANGETEEETLKRLRKAIEGWVIYKIEDQDRDIPVLDSIDLNRL